MKIHSTSSDNVKNKTEKKSFISKSETISSPQQYSFLEILESIVTSTKEETREINSLWQKLPDIEKRFLKEPNQQNLNTYKSLVKDIVNAIMKNNMKLSQARQRGRTDKKILMTVKIIDENIQILAMTMLNPANSAFSLLKQLERIRGLIMDILE
jgi:uncharacterized protein YaaR (DUF327 family)